ANMKDLSLREILVLSPLVIFIFWIGIYPNSFLRYTQPVSERIVQITNPQPLAEGGAKEEASHE
ncbi:MAG: Fe-S-binding domain-containing protein, partial [candidate division WOR-3 bacterium]